MLQGCGTTGSDLKPTGLIESRTESTPVRNAGWRELMARNRCMVGMVFLTFFVISLLTNILGPIVPDIISSFHVSLTAAGFLAFAFFIAYGIMSIPAGFLVEGFTEKPVMVMAFLAATLGSLSFAVFSEYRVAVISLFIIGAGMATLQVAINPLLRISGGEEHYAFNSAVAQLVFGSASFLSPRLYSYLVQHLRESSPTPSAVMRLLARVTPPHLPWASIYWIFAATALLMVVVLSSRGFLVSSTQPRNGLAPGKCITAWRASAWSGCTLRRCSPTSDANRVQPIGFRVSSINITALILTRQVPRRSRGSGGCSPRAVWWEWYC